MLKGVLNLITIYYWPKVGQKLKEICPNEDRVENVPA